MIVTPIAVQLPLREDEHGTIRMGGTRVTLESVIADFERGATPEEIVHDYPVLKVADVYQVIGYYLANRVEVEAYLQRQREEAEHLRAEWEMQHPPRLTKADLLARLNATRDQDQDG